MPERLDHITIALSGGYVSLTWTTRQALMARLQHIRESSSLRATFGALGATRPVELNPAQRATLLGLLGEWTLGQDADEAMPAELNELRDALREDLAGLK